MCSQVSEMIKTYPDLIPVLGQLGDTHGYKYQD